MGELEPGKGLGKGWFRKALQSVPALKWALGVAALAAIFGAARAYVGGDPAQIIGACLIVLLLSTVLVLFSTFAAKKTTAGIPIDGAIRVLLWLVVAIVVTSGVLATTSFWFGFPLPLNPKPEQGSVYVDCKLNGATIEVDGAHWGVSPTWGELSSGRHIIRCISPAGDASPVLAIDVTPGQRVDIPLQRVPDASIVDAAQIQDANPADATPPTPDARTDAQRCKTHQGMCLWCETTAELTDLAPTGYSCRRAPAGANVSATITISNTRRHLTGKDDNSGLTLNCPSNELVQVTVEVGDVTRAVTTPLDRPFTISILNTGRPVKLHVTSCHHCGGPTECWGKAKIKFFGP